MSIKQARYSQFAIWGFILAFLFPPVGLILSIIGVNVSSKHKLKGKSLAIVGIIISSIIIIAMIGSITLNDVNNNSSYQNSQITTNVSQNSDPYENLVHNDKLVILNHNFSYSEFGNLEVTGTAQNIAGRELSYAQIDVKFYDKDGAVIGTSLDNINNLAPGEKWKFEVMYIDFDTSKVASYKIDVGSSW